MRVLDSLLARLGDHALSDAVEQTECAAAVQMLDLYPPTHRIFTDPTIRLGLARSVPISQPTLWFSIVG